MISTARREQVVRSFSSLSSFSRKLQPKYSGRYSDERVLELARYQSETSNYRAAGVLLLSMLPCIVVTTIADLVPLQPPSRGVLGNPGFIARAFITHLVFSFLALTQFRLYVGGLQLSNTRVAIFSIFASLGTLASDAALVYAIGFPLPFSFLLSSCTAWIAFMLLALMVAGVRQVLTHEQQRQQLFNALCVWSGQFFLVITWGVYFTALTFTPTSYRPALMVALPALKVLLRLGFSRALPHLRDDSPEVVTFNADMFTSLFLSYMAQSTTLLVTLGLIGLDGLRTILFVRETLKLNKQVVDLEVALYRVEEEIGSSSCTGMLYRASSELQKSRCEPRVTIRKIVPASNRLKSWIMLLVTFRRQNNAVVPMYMPATSFERSQRATQVVRIDDSERVILPVPRRKTRLQERYHSSGEITSEARLYIDRAQQVLYTMEFVMLLNYVEFAVPAIYGVYLTITFLLPNRRYYPQFIDQNVSRFSQTMANVLLYFLMQLLALGLICAVYERKFRVSGLKQIAFVLEKQALQVQLKMIFWVFYLAQSGLEHAGFDYTFKFSWLQSQM